MTYNSEAGTRFISLGSKITLNLFDPRNGKLLIYDHLKIVKLILEYITSQVFYLYICSHTQISIKSNLRLRYRKTV